MIRNLLEDNKVFILSSSVNKSDHTYNSHFFTLPLRFQLYRLGNSRLIHIDRWHEEMEDVITKNALVIT